MWKFIGQVVTWLALLAMAAVLTVAVLVPRIVGATPYTVATGSMRPDLAPGALVVVEPTPFDEIGIGDVITYQLESGEPAVVTHRVVGIGADGRGERVLRTQGDANPSPDPELVRAVQVRGTAMYAVPHLGRVSTLLDNNQRQWAIYATAALLLGYALVLWTGALRARAPQHQNGEDTHAARKHASTRPRRPSGRIRALLSLGMLVGIAQVGTLAAWTDSATVESGSFATGTLDLRVGDEAADQLGGQGGTWQHSALALNDLAPGESVAARITVGNGGSIPLAYTAAVSSVDEALSGPNGLKVTVVEGATGVTNTGSHGANDRFGTCEGGTPTAATDAPVNTSVTAISDAPIALAPGARTTYCVVARLSSDAPNSMQSKTSKIVFTFDAEQ